MGRNILIILVVVAILILVGCASYCSAQTNLIPNPSFEDDRDGDAIPDGWETDATDDSLLRLEKEGYEGKRAISIKGHGLWRSQLKEVIPHHWYLLSLWVKRDGFIDGEYPIVRLLGREIKLDELFSWGRWLRLSRLLYLGGHQETAEIALINPGMRHKIWFDEIRLVPFTVTPLYPRNREVLSQGTPFFAWRIPGDGRVYEIQIELINKKEFNENKIYTTYSPQGALYWVSEPFLPGKYRWRIKVYHNGALIASSQKVSFEVTKMLHPAAGMEPTPLPPRSLDSFFPLGIYGATIKRLPDLKRAGFNCVQTYRREIGFLREFIERANRPGLRVMVPYPEKVGKEALITFLNDIKNSETVLAWYLADEPEGRATPPSYIWQCRLFLRHFTPFPGALVLLRAERARDYAPAADILMVDPYPIPKMPLTWLSDSLEEAKKWAWDKPVWAVIQAFDWSSCPLDDDPRSWGRYPAYEEERCLSYLALVHGAKGLFYYKFEAEKYRSKNYLQHWNNVKKVVSELRSIYPLLPAPVDSSCQLDVEPPEVHCALKKVEKGDDRGLIEKGYYLIAVNTTKKPLKAAFAIPFRFDGEANVLFDKRSVPINEGKLIDDFEPYGVHVYVLQLES